MPDSPLVSVVIPAYQVSDYIGETLTSVFNQTFQNFEVIVVNDCCPDSERLNLALAPFLPRIHYILRETNGGVSAARNSAIRAARGEWIAFLDGDDLWEPNYLAVQAALMREHPEACIVYGNARIIGSIYDGRDSQSYSPSIGPVTISNILLQHVNVPVLNVSRRKAVLDAGLFDEQLRRCEDFDLWLRMVLGGCQVIYHSQVIACYRRREGSLSTDPRKMLDARLAVLHKLQQDPRLKGEDRALAQELALRWTAEAELELGKRAFAAGKRDEAVRYLTSANAYYKRPKVTIARLMMQYCPGVLRLSMKLRGAAGGA